MQHPPGVWGGQFVPGLRGAPFQRSPASASQSGAAIYNPGRVALPPDLQSGRDPQRLASSRRPLRTNTPLCALPSRPAGSRIWTRSRAPWLPRAHPATCELELWVRFGGRCEKTLNDSSCSSLSWERCSVLGRGEKRRESVQWVLFSKSSREEESSY